MTEAQAPLLQVQNLRVEFGGETDQRLLAVDGISFSLERGETLGIAGESGSGKSVTALALMGLLPPAARITGGSVRFGRQSRDRKDLLQQPLPFLRRLRGKHLAMVFQEPMNSLNPVYHCGEQVAEVLYAHEGLSWSQARKRALALFEQTRLPEPERIYRAYPHQLSGGQQQRVMIAIAMACRPDLLIADEPTTALDVTVQQTILELIRELSRQYGTSVIFITHDLGVMARVADRLLIMHRGKIVESGEAEALFRHPQHPYTKGLLACRPPLDRRLFRLPVMEDFNREALAEPQARLRQLEAPPGHYASRIASLEKQQPLLRVKNLKTWFATGGWWQGRKREWVKAVDDVSFDIYPGETFGLVGESGCGKTTLGRSLLGLIPARGGSVIYRQQPIFDLSEEAMRRLRREMQIVFQDPMGSLNPRMTVGAAVREPLLVHKMVDQPGMAREKAIELLRTVGLEAEHYNRYPRQLSGGQLQRVCIARALAVNPRFIVCDESVSALDVSVQAQVLNLLLQLREDYGLTYVFISHDLSVVKLMSDRLMVMKDGKIEEMGPAEEVYHQPQSPYTRKLIEAIPRW